jgi:predicted transcriptional regulator
MTVELPDDLHRWLREAAEISHRTVDTMVTDVLQRERQRWDANWNSADDGGPSAR